MANLSHADIVSKIKYSMKHKGEGYNFPLMEEYNKTAGNISHSCYTVVTGLPGSGRSSFVSLNYVLGPLLQWYFEPPEDREPLKIIYFTTTATELKVRQMLLCQYLKVVEGVTIDIPTLNSHPGEDFSLTAKTGKNGKKAKRALTAFDLSKPFFDAIINEGILEIVEGTQKPSDIFNKVGNFMDTIGDIDEDTNKYVRSTEPEGQTLVITVVDNTEHLRADSDEFATVLYGNELDKHLDAFMVRMKMDFGVHGVLITPTAGRTGLVRSVVELRPHYKHLGPYSTNCDIGVGLYAPNKEKDVRLLDDSEERYTSSKKMDCLRTWSIIRHSHGPDFKSGCLAFHGGCGYIVEVDDGEISAFGDVVTVFKTPSPYVLMKKEFETLMEDNGSDWRDFPETE